MRARLGISVPIWLAAASQAVAQPSGDAGTALPPPEDTSFAVPSQFHGRWLPAATGCSTNPAQIATIISAAGLQRGEHWAEPVQLIAFSSDGRRLAMQADLYFEAPPVLHESVWQLSDDQNGLVVTDTRLNRSDEEDDEMASQSEHRVELVRCDG